MSEPVRDPAKTRGVDGRFLPVHGAYELESAWRRGTMRRRDRRMVNRLRFEFAVAAGYPSFPSTPAPLRAAIDNAIRLKFLAERFFQPFWQDQDVAKRFDTVSENLRRALADLGLTPRTPAVDVAALLARTSRARTSSGRGEGS